MIRLAIDADGVNGLVLNKEYTKIGDSNIEKMLSEIKNYKDNFDV